MRNFLKKHKSAIPIAGALLMTGAMFVLDKLFGVEAVIGGCVACLVVCFEMAMVDYLSK